MLRSKIGLVNRFLPRSDVIVIEAYPLPLYGFTANSTSPALVILKIIVYFLPKKPSPRGEGGCEAAG